MFAGYLRDLSERKRAEQELERLAAIVEYSNDAIVAVRPGGEVIAWNPGAERLYGYSAEEAIGRHIGFTVPPHLKAESADLVQARGRGRGGAEPPDAEAAQGRQLDRCVAHALPAAGRGWGVDGHGRDHPRHHQAEARGAARGVHRRRRADPRRLARAGRRRPQPGSAGGAAAGGLVRDPRARARRVGRAAGGAAQRARTRAACMGARPSLPDPVRPARRRAQGAEDRRAAAVPGDPRCACWWTAPRTKSTCDWSASWDCARP